MSNFKCCIDCEKRTIGCHSTCLEYIAAKKKNEENVLKRHEEQAKKSAIYEYEQRRSDSIKRSHSGTRKK